MSDGQNSKIANLINRKSNVKIQILLENVKNSVHFDADKLVGSTIIKTKATTI